MKTGYVNNTYFAWMEYFEIKRAEFGNEIAFSMTLFMYRPAYKLMQAMIKKKFGVYIKPGLQEIDATQYSKLIL